MQVYTNQGVDFDMFITFGWLHEYYSTYAKTVSLNSVQGTLDWTE